MSNADNDQDNDQDNSYERKDKNMELRRQTDEEPGTEQDILLQDPLHEYDEDTLRFIGINDGSITDDCATSPYISENQIDDLLLWRSLVDTGKKNEPRDEITRDAYRVMRGFGAFVGLRDEPMDEPIPDGFFDAEDEDDKQAGAALVEYKRMSARSDWEWSLKLLASTYHDAEYEKKPRVLRNASNVSLCRVTIPEYENALTALREWEPSEPYVNYRESLLRRVENNLRYARDDMEYAKRVAYLDGSDYDEYKSIISYGRDSDDYDNDTVLTFSIDDIADSNDPSIILRALGDRYAFLGRVIVRSLNLLSDALKTVPSADGGVYDGVDPVTVVRFKDRVLKEQKQLADRYRDAADAARGNSRNRGREWYEGLEDELDPILKNLGCQPLASVAFKNAQNK